MLTDQFSFSQFGVLLSLSKLMLKYFFSAFLQDFIETFFVKTEVFIHPAIAVFQ